MTKTAEGKPINILLVEDNPGDIRLTQEALKQGKVLNNLYVVTDGVQAVDFLAKHEPFAGSVTPDLILLDLNLPKKDGRQVLKEMKEDAKLKQIPIVILTTSSEEQDIFKSYNLHANCYITKPVELESFINVIRSIENFWLTIVKLPTVLE